MIPVFAVAADLLREAASRKWFLGLMIAITGLLVTLGFSLQIEVIDGALAGTKFFGSLLDHDIRSADVALRPVFMGASYVIFYGGLVFGVLACCDFAPGLLSPGRIEHLLSLPLRRWQLLAGTFLGVMVLSVVGSLYGAGGFTVILGFKTGIWTWNPIYAALLASVAFCAIYSAMLALSVFIRSAAVTAAAGGGLFVLGIIASYRVNIAPAFDPGFPRETFLFLTSLLPRVGSLADAAGQIAGSFDFDAPALAARLVGFVVFSLSALAVGIWHFEQKDF